MRAAVAAVLGKELMDHLRDRRSLVSALIFPIFGPLTFLVLMNVTAGWADSGKAPKLAVEGMDRAPNLVAFLRKQGTWADARTPDLVLLDLNLPRVDGRQVLSEIKSDPALAHLPVVVLTTSDLEEDVVASYQLHANAYVTKPVDFGRFIEVVRQIDEFFVTVVRLPRR